jgi:unsaturated pyranuronate lyase
VTEGQEEDMKDWLIKSKGIPFEELKPGVSRRILGYLDSLMAVEMQFQKGAIGDLHSHPHAQTGYVLQGSFDVQVGDKKDVLRQGDCYFAEPHVMHGVVCLEDNSRLLDVFTPKREDFLK